MRHIRLHDGWQIRPRQSIFAEMTLGGVEWEPVAIPHDAMISGVRAPSHGPASGYFGGGSWEYRTTLQHLPEESATTAILKFEGVYRDAVVRVNGSIAGHRASGYSPFYVPIDHLFLAGSDNEITVEARAGNDSRWYSGAGLYRNVWLLRAGPVHLVADRLDIRTPEIDDLGTSVVVQAVTQNRTSTKLVATVRTELTDAQGQAVASDEAPVTLFPNQGTTSRQRLFVSNPQRWGIDHPYLYQCRVSLLIDGNAIDDEVARFGVRTLAVDPQRGLRINGEPTLLRGACVHHDNGLLGAATVDRADERRVERLKAAGFNAIRSAHNPMSTAMLDACDRLGVVVMDEAFDMWAGQKSDDDYALRFHEWWERDLEAMVRHDVNHPSVIFYSIGNEIPDIAAPSGLQLGRALADRLRSIDDSRLITEAVNGIVIGGSEIFGSLTADLAEVRTEEQEGVNSAALALADILSNAMRSPVIDQRMTEPVSHLDVAGYNYMTTRFDLDTRAYPNRVIVATETYPATMEEGWAGVTRHPAIIGDFTWTGWDYLGEAGIGRVAYGEAAEGGAFSFHGEYPWLAAWCGDLDLIGNRRPQSYYREIVFGQAQGPYLAIERPEHHDQVITHPSPWGWPDLLSGWSWDGSEGQLVHVHVYARADEVELVLNGSTISRRPVGTERPHQAVFDVEFQPGELEAIAWVGETEIGRARLRSATGPARLVARTDRAEIRADGSDAAFTEVNVIDAAGSLYHQLDLELTVAVEGAGVLAGLGSANPCHDGRFTDSTCTTFEGRALAIVRPTGPGPITLTASADGYEPTVATMTAVGPV